MWIDTEKVKITDFNFNINVATEIPAGLNHCNFNWAGVCCAAVTEELAS